MLKHGDSKRLLTRGLAAWFVLFAIVAGTPALAKTLYVKGNSVNIRSGPSTKTDVVTKLNQGHALEFVERQGRWLKIVITGLNGTEGWIREDLVSDTARRQPSPDPALKPPADPALKPPSVAELSTTAGVVDALNKAPRDRVLEAFKVAIKAADKTCTEVRVLSRVKSGPEGAYYYVECDGRARYSVLVKPDGKMGTRVTQCPPGFSEENRDLCRPA